jgi:hypothetical protein
VTTTKLSSGCDWSLGGSGYPRLVLAGKMTCQKADAETEAMKAIVATLESVAAEEATR